MEDYQSALSPSIDTYNLAFSLCMKSDHQKGVSLDTLLVAYYNTFAEICFDPRPLASSE